MGKVSNAELKEVFKGLLRLLTVLETTFPVTRPLVRDFRAEFTPLLKRLDEEE